MAIEALGPPRYAAFDTGATMRVKKVQRLSDWFDCLLVLSKAPAGPEALVFANAFRAYGWTWMDGRSTAPAGLVERPLQVLPDLTDTNSGPEMAAAIGEWLRARHLKRPLFWIEDPSFLPVLDAFPHAFSVALEPGASGKKGRAREADLMLGRPASASATWLAATEQAICLAVQARLSEGKSLNVLVLYDDQFTFVGTFYEHLNALRRYSRHEVLFLPGGNEEGHYDRLDAWPAAWDLDLFDAVVWHYSIRISNDRQFYAPLLEKLARFTGVKVLFIQDEYDDVHDTWAMIRQLGINLVMTCATNETSARRLYPQQQTPGVETLPTLTGYVPEDAIERYAAPMEARGLRIAYRGRTLDYRYGTLGQEKYNIGIQMRRAAQERGVAIDIELDESSRIYGDDWYRFLGSARATLASESGSLAADFDGSLKTRAAAAMAAGQSFEDFHREHLAELETIAPINVVSPKIFEAIRLRTALICFEGEYSGVVQPGRHYIPLKKDYSNVDEVFAKLEDTALLQAMTERAYSDVIESGIYSYRTFVSEFDEILAGRALNGRRAEIISAPVAWRPSRGVELTGLFHSETIDYALSTAVLRKGYQAPQLADAVASPFEDVKVFYDRRGLGLYRRARPERIPDDNFRFWRAGPDAVTISNAWLQDGARLVRAAEGARIETVARPGHYAARVAIDLEGPDLDEEFCWVRLRLRDVEGELRICLYDAARDEVGTDQRARQQAGEQEVLFAIDGKIAYSHLMLRSSERAGEGHPAGTAVFVEADMVVCSQYEPNLQAAARKLISYPRGALRAQPRPRWTGAQPQETPFLHRPAAEARIVRSIPATDLFTVPYWENLGARVDSVAQGRRVTTPAAAFTYAAGLRLDLHAEDFVGAECWIKMILDGVVGPVQLGISNAEGKLYAFETNVPEMSAPGAVYWKIDPKAGDLLLFRTGPLDRAGEAVFLGAEILAG